jgi:hypothetical protein
MTDNVITISLKLTMNDDEFDDGCDDECYDHGDDER